MPTLRQLLAAHASVLLIDAASSRVQVGLLAADGTGDWATSTEEAGVGVFQCLEQLKVHPGYVGAFIFCDGPGSVLGIRTVAMALRTWSMLTPRPLFAYHSLAVVAQALNRPGVQIIADARRDAWHCLTVGETLRRVPTAGLGNEFMMPEGFRHWTPLPAGLRLTPYSLATLLPQIMDEDLFRVTEAPDAFLHEEPSYVTWTPQIHRAP
jgi:tRNA threonylcarbamoyladenosine biosynthesis protein TsaB